MDAVNGALRSNVSTVTLNLRRSGRNGWLEWRECIRDPYQMSTGSAWTLRFSNPCREVLLCVAVQTGCLAIR